ncbi:Cgr1p [Sugiyamaella lignohabitans]|uniref:rRNA-processing protein CGR1 n=1 Tax=Sugiyamaella lignohabitans TaxID=796027 RepID=A0A161HJP4_9ASCO|nr:Cgr1p [Sugiyamaella lignohabitans]ANB12967.1 Cgr1p [Sugiyamaella lignohabitans]
MFSYLLKKTGLKSDDQENLTDNKMAQVAEKKVSLETKGTQTSSPQVQSDIKDVVDAPAPSKPLGMRVSGKQWKESKKPLRTNAVVKTAWEKKRLAQLELKAIKAKEKELKDEKQAATQARIKAIKEKKAAKEEKERYAKLSEKMHAKRVARLRKREKRNKLLKER